MNPHLPHKPHRHPGQEDDPEPGLLPVEPDQGTAPLDVPEDEERDRECDPEA